MIAIEPGASPRFRVAVLGPLRVWHGDTEVELGPVRQQAFFAAMALRPNIAVSQQELLNDVWGTELPGTGAKVVPGYVYRLRKCLHNAADDVLDPLITSDRYGYRFSSRDAWVDSAEMERAASAAACAVDSGDIAAGVAVYSRAIDMFRGEPLTGLPGPFVAAERRRLTERKLALQQSKAESQLLTGQHAEAVAELSVLLEIHPHSETLAALLMRSLYASGRKADALAVYVRMRDRLMEHLGVKPGEELRRVHHAILRGETATTGAVSIPVAPTRPRAAGPPSRRVRNDLPAALTELIGRERELAQLTAPAGASTVSVDVVDGVAGSGKTALAVAAARLLRVRYSDGSLFVDLRGHAKDRDPLHPERALRRLLRAVGVDDNDVPDDLDELAASWRAATDPLRLLLLLDDAASAEQIRPLLPSGAGSKVLVTSRQRLAGLETDSRVSLGPLEPDEAEGLLSRLAGRSRADNEPEAVRELARLCDRLPLALLIAGSRLQNRPMWTFGYLNSRLACDGQLLGELSADDRSVEAAFRLSYEQLSADQQRAFRMLGVSPTVEFDRLTLAALLGCPVGDAEQALEGLVDASLVQQPAAGRYRLHDLVAAYVRRLIESEPVDVVNAARANVFRLYVTAGRYASDWGPEGFPTGPELGDSPFTGWEDAVTWLDAAGGELTDVVGHAIAVGEAEYACWIAEALVDYFIRQDRYHECRVALESVLPLTDTGSDRRMASSLRTWLGFAYGMQGRQDHAHACFTAALRNSLWSGDMREQARAVGGLGLVAEGLGQFTEAAADLNKVLELARPLDDDWLIGMAMFHLGIIHHLGGERAEALDCLAASMARAEKIGSPRPIAKTLCYISLLHLDAGEYAEAAALLRRAADVAEDANDRSLRACSLTRLGTAEQGLGNLDRAVELHHRALVAITEQTNTETEMEVRNRLGGTYLAGGDGAKAREQFILVLDLVGAGSNPVERARALDGLERC